MSKQQSQLLLDGWHQIYSVTLLINVIVYPRQEPRLYVNVPVYSTLTSPLPPHCPDSLYGPFCTAYDASQSELGSLSKRIHVWRVGEGPGGSSIPTLAHGERVNEHPDLNESSRGPRLVAGVTWRGYGLFFYYYAAPCSMQSPISSRSLCKLREQVFTGVWLWKEHESEGEAGWIHSRETRGLNESGRMQI